jgi:hypothetical protein
MRLDWVKWYLCNIVKNRKQGGKSNGKLFFEFLL